jgi:methylase of polypeptide subunit release factors
LAVQGEWPSRVVDIGTGSGRLPSHSLTADEVGLLQQTFREALAVAQINASRLNLNRGNSSRVIF